jgi:hypothetical protein
MERNDAINGLVEREIRVLGVIRNVRNRSPMTGKEKYQARVPEADGNGTS